MLKVFDNLKQTGPSLFTIVTSFWYFAALSLNTQFLSLMPLAIIKFWSFFRHERNDINGVRFRFVFEKAFDDEKQTFLLQNSRYVILVLGSLNAETNFCSPLDDQGQSQFDDIIYHRIWLFWWGGKTRLGKEK